MSITSRVVSHMLRSMSQPFGANCDQTARRREQLGSDSNPSNPKASSGPNQASTLTPKPQRERWRRYAIAFAIVLFICAFAAYGALQAAIASMGPLPLAHASQLADAPRPITARSRNLTRPASAGSLPLVVNPEDVDPLYLKMLFTFEDRRFYSHFGVDPIALCRAALELIWRGKIITGGSTLTMQVARLLENKYQRTPLVKFRQIVRALQLEQTFSKREILRLYLNLAPFGGHRKGVSAATLSYFGKPSHKLSIGEAALLVALPQAPEARRIDRDPAAARRSRDFVLRVVTAAGVITPAQARMAMQEPIVPIPRMDPRRVVSFEK